MTAWKNDYLFNRNPFLPANAVKHAVQSFDSINIEEMDSVKLMDRFDTKFVFSLDQLPAILQSASNFYRVLQINHERIFSYTSTYYDTVGHEMYHDHHNRKLNRFKVRRREYLNSGQVFFEVKYKSNKGLTRKKRIQTTNRNKNFCTKEKKFLKRVTPYRAKMLYPVLNNQFCRITLVHKFNAERVTIDFDVKFDYCSNTAGFPSLTIAEIKQGKSSGKSDLKNIFNENNIKSMNFSKYCMGTVLLNPAIKYNRFKQNFLSLQKLSNNSKYASINY